MSYAVLATLVQNCALDPHTLATVSQTCKPLHDLARHAWSALAARYATHGTLHMRIQRPSRACRVSKTQAMKRLKLTPHDLGALGPDACHVARHPIWGTRIDYFHPATAWWLACVKHGGPRGVRMALAPRPSKAQEERRAHWEAQGIEVSERQYAMCVEPFVRNGKGGMRAVRLRLQRYDALQDANVPYAEVWAQPFVECRLSLDEVRQRGARAEELAWALAACGVEFCPTHAACAAYVERGEGGLDAAVHKVVLRCRRDACGGIARLLKSVRGWAPLDTDRGREARESVVQLWERCRKHTVATLAARFQAS